MAYKPKSKSEVTPEVIKSWKSEYGKVMKYEAEGKVAYFREPDIKTLDASAAMATTNPIRSNEIMAKACFLGGDEDIITEQKYFLGFMDHLKKLINKVEGEFSEL